MSKFIDYYDILGISPNATEQEIKKAFQKIAKTCHPDMTKDLTEEERQKRQEIFIKATEGKNILTNETKRTAYDTRYKKHQARKQEKKQEDTPFWEKPNWGGYQRTNEYNDNDSTQYDNQYEETDYDDQYDNQYEETDYDEQYEEDYYTMSDRIKEMLANMINAYCDVKEEEYSISERTKEYYRILNRKKDVSFVKKGLFIFGCEILYSKEKLKIKRNDDISHYVIRNRGKALVAAGLAVTLATGIFTPKEENTKEPPITQNPIIETLPIEEPTLTIMRTYTVEPGDTLSYLAESANCTKQEIKELNNMNTDYLYQNDIIRVPYHIPEDEIGRYTTIELYQGENLYDFAENYETTPESLQRLNPESIIKVNKSYTVMSENIIIPTFAPYKYGSSKIKR